MDLSFAFALMIIDYCDQQTTRKKYQISDQLIRSGTSIGANVREAQSAESLADFIHKNKIALKEAEETEYWLLLCSHQDKLPICDTQLARIQEIKKILNTIIASSKNRLKQGR
jgi:four helix bundle protein